MKKAAVLNQILNKIDRKGYKAYKDIEGTFFFEEENYTLFIDHVQGDPFAAPSIIRMFADAIKRHSKVSRGSGKSGKISIDRPGQEILERTAAFIDGEKIEVRFNIGLPAFGRKIAGKEAQEIFFQELPNLVINSLLFKNLSKDNLEQHFTTNEDEDFLREALKEKKLVSFVANGSVLPRISGVDPGPMEKENVIPFQSPENLELEFKLPNKGPIRGMGVRK